MARIAAAAVSRCLIGPLQRWRCWCRSAVPTALWLRPAPMAVSRTASRLAVRRGPCC
uniref:Uncharacterized protein n=1 Tax=Ulva partita TaxID=1605170 RepID=A0A1C9ZPT4_9CHLO|nr:hypothetical protein [Ulva partita]